jgi:hypothetical protein
MLHVKLDNICIRSLYIGHANLLSIGGFMKKLLLCAIGIALAGCSFAPFKNLTPEETNSMLNSLSGTYRVIDSRENKYSKYTGMNVTLTTKGGVANLTSDGGATTTLQLLRCEIANNAQAKNSGDPIESVEKLFICDVSSDYRYAHIYIGQVKSNYAVSDKVSLFLKSFTPMTITGGYFIEIVLSPGSDVLLNATKE